MFKEPCYAYYLVISVA